MKVIEGTDRPDRTNGAMPDFVAGRPVAPKGLPKNVAARFDALVEKLEAMRVLTEQDGEIVLRLARRLVEIERCEAYLDKHGDTYTLDSGQIRTRPEVTIRNEAERAARSLLSECGLGPASRAKVSKVDGSGRASPFAAFKR